MAQHDSAPAEGLKSVGIRLPSDTYRLAQLLAVRDDTSVAKMLEGILETELQERASEVAQAAEDTAAWVRDNFRLDGDRTRPAIQRVRGKPKANSTN